MSCLFVLLNSLLTLLSFWLYQVQIGCQTDNVDCREELRRAPCVHKTIKINTPMMQVWNLWGGLLYLVAPPDTGGRAKGHHGKGGSRTLL